MFGYSDYHTILILVALGGAVTGFVHGLKQTSDESERTVQHLLLLPVYMVTGALVFITGTVVGWPFIGGVLLTMLDIIKWAVV